MTNNNRYLSIDLLKLISLISIVTLHTNEFIFYEDIFPLMGTSILYKNAMPFARFFSYSGHTIVYLLFYFWGLNGTPAKKLLKVVPIILLGQLILSTSFNSFEKITFEMDIYFFLALSILIMLVVRKFPFLIQFILLLIPSFFYFLPLPHEFFGENIFREIFTGRCEMGGSGAWPIIPWIQIPLMATFHGTLFSKYPQWLKKFHFFEYLIWPFFFVIVLIGYGALYKTPIGPHYYCFMLDNRGIPFWSSFLVPLFIIRTSGFEAVQSWLKRIPIVLFCVQINWVRHFGLCYLIHIILLSIMSLFDTFFSSHAGFFDLWFVGQFFVIEALAKLILSKSGRIHQLIDNFRKETPQ